VAEVLQKEPGVVVEVVNGGRGEFKVLVDGQVVARKGLLFKPSVEKVLAAVRGSGPAKAGSRG